ncbi:hypothetical protein Tco_0268069 [Tanacetum coccineum]
MLPRRRPTTLCAYGVFARRSLPVVPSSPLAIWAGCPSLLRSVRLWITGTNVVEWNSRRVTHSTMPRFEVQVVMITSGYALAPLTSTPEPGNACENLGRSVLHSSDQSGIGADSASAASCRTGVIQYVVPHVPPLLRSFPILIVKHHEQQDVEVRASKEGKWQGISKKKNEEKVSTQSQRNSYGLLPSFSSNWGSSGTIESLKLRNYRISQELNKLLYASRIRKHDKSVLHILASSLVFKERKLQRLTNSSD